MKQKKQKIKSKSFDESIVELLKEDPGFAAKYLKTAFEEAGEKDGQYVLLKVLKQIAEAQGISKVAKKAGIPRESLYRALSSKGNPRLDTLFPLVNAMGYRLSVQMV